MKNKILIKRICKRVASIGAAMLFALLFCILLTVSASANDKAQINGVSLGLQNRVELLFRASYPGLHYYTYERDYDNAEIWLEIRTSAPNASGDWTQLDYYRQDGAYYYYSYSGLTAMQMSESIYARAVLHAYDDDDRPSPRNAYVYSDVVRYSVLDYAHDTKNSANTRVEGGSTLGEMVQKILEYGATSQTYFGYNTDRLPTDEYYQVIVRDGTFSDGVKTAIVFSGESVTITANAAPAGGCFDHWEDENGQFVSDQATATVSPTADATYTAVFWTESGISLGLAFTDLDATTCALSGMGTCTDTDLVIPNRAPNGKWVTKINAEALAGNTTITSVRIPASVTEIEAGAFRGCTSLATIAVEAGNTVYAASDFLYVTVEGGTFSGGLTNDVLLLGESVTLTAGAAPAGGCFDHWEDENGQFVSDQATATVSPTADATYTAVFWTESGISLWLAYTDLDATTCALSGMGTCTDTDLVIPNRAPNGKWVTKINAEALAGNTTITSVRIPASVTEIEAGAFRGCTSLATVTVEAGNTVYAASDFLYVTVEGGTFSDGLTNDVLLLGESVTLTAGAAPAGGTFDHWEDADEQFVSDQSTVSVSPTASVAYVAVFNLPEVEEGVSLDLEFEDIDEETCALSGMGDCTDVDLVIPNRSPEGKTVTKINADALAGNTNLTSVRIPASVTTIEDGAFDGCTSITAFVVQDGNTSFSTYYGTLLTYDGSTILRYPTARADSLTFPDSVRTIADHAFEGATLSNVTLNADLEVIGDYAFAGSLITSIKIKTAVTSIGAFAFDHCNKMTAVSVESANENYKSSSYAIYTKDGLTLIRAKNYSTTSFLTGVTTIAPGAYSGCDKLTTLRIPNTVTTVGEGAFADCTKISSLTVGTAVERIETRAFYGCSGSSFTSVTLPASLDYLGDSAFENCTNLATATLNHMPTYAGVNIFLGTSVLNDPFTHEHAYTRYLKLVDATCTSAAIYTHACTCGENNGERIVSSTATAHSYSNGVCSVCGQQKPDTSYDSYLILPDNGTYYGMFDPSQSSYSSKDDANILYYTSFTSANFDSYLQKLNNAGLTQVETYTLGSNRYALFHHSQYTLYASYLDYEQALRVYVGKPDDVNPSKAPVADAEFVTPSLWQININNKNAGANGGMSYIIQLTDGKFIVVDGGYENTSADAKSIYDILMAYKPASHAKPIIAGWFFTHMHIDHVGAYRAFTNNSTYRNAVTVEAFYYNFLYVNVGDLWPSNSQTWENHMASNWPSATRYRKLHSGMNFFFSGAEVKILCTPEDVYPLSFNSGNDTSVVFQVIIGGQKILFLGDAEFGESDTMYKLGKSVMKSDILQYAHHGYENQCRTNLYQLIEPSTVLWPMPIVNYQSSSYGECFRPRYQSHSENSWVRSASCVKKIIVMEEGTTRLMLPYTPTGSRNANYTQLYNQIVANLN